MSTLAAVPKFTFTIRRSVIVNSSGLLPFACWMQNSCLSSNQTLMSSQVKVVHQMRWLVNVLSTATKGQVASDGFRVAHRQQLKSKHFQLDFIFSCFHPTCMPCCINGFNLVISCDLDHQILHIVRVEPGTPFTPWYCRQPWGKDTLAVLKISPWKQCYASSVLMMNCGAMDQHSCCDLHHRYPAKVGVANDQWTEGCNETQLCATKCSTSLRVKNTN